MGMTMMPIMSAALATLSNKQVPDGSTLMNVVQQTASSIGTAVISVILATNLKAHAESQLAIASNAAPEKYDLLVKAGQAPQDPPGQWFSWAAEAFGATFIVAVALIAVTIIPAFFLPRRKIASPLVEEDDDRAPIVMH